MALVVASMIALGGWDSQAAFEQREEEIEERDKPVRREDSEDWG